MDEVASVQGTPDYLTMIQWSYSGAYLTFANGKVNGWSNVGGKLKLQMPSAGSNPNGTFAVGATDAEVAAVQGTPDFLGSDRWAFGSSTVDFQSGRVVGWSNAGGNLKARVEPAGSPAAAAPSALARGAPTDGISGFFNLTAWIPDATNRLISFRTVGPTYVSRPVGPGMVRPDAIDVARTQLGRPYVWGGASPQTSFDCSGLVQWSFRQLGVNLPRTAQQQYNVSVPITVDQLRPGDLVFYARTYADPNDWITHVGIYIGDGRMINATGDGGSVAETPAFSGSIGSHFAGAGRVRA
jgi:cell wall-associated NlpC family hydrolase